MTVSWARPPNDDGLTRGEGRPCNEQAGDPRDSLLGGNNESSIATTQSLQAGVWLRRQAIAEFAEILESLSISLREAAFRGSDATTRITLAQLRETLKSAIVTFKEIPVADDAGGGQ